ncbi:hypothetical protein D3C76_1365540 [compost metagenome]
MVVSFSTTLLTATYHGAEQRFITSKRDSRSQRLATYRLNIFDDKRHLMSLSSAHVVGNIPDRRLPYAKPC